MKISIVKKIAQQEACNNKGVYKHCCVVTVNKRITAISRNNDRTRIGRRNVPSGHAEHIALDKTFLFRSKKYRQKGYSVYLPSRQKQQFGSKSTMFSLFRDDKKI